MHQVGFERIIVTLLTLIMTCNLSYLYNIDEQLKPGDCMLLEH